jgi:hypothetical protein
VGIAVGDVVTLAVTEVAGYACWGFVGEQMGFVHCYEWSWERPIPESDQPRVGDSLTVKVFHLIDQAQSTPPPDVTYGGKFKVDFAGSVKLLRPKPAGDAA